MLTLFYSVVTHKAGLNLSSNALLYHRELWFPSLHRYGEGILTQLAILNGPTRSTQRWNPWLLPWPTVGDAIIPRCTIQCHHGNRTWLPGPVVLPLLAWTRFWPLW